GYIPDPASVDFVPATLNQRSHGQYVTVQLGFPSNAPVGERAADVDVSTVRLRAFSPVSSPTLPVAAGAPTSVNNNQRLVKFDRATVQGWFSQSVVETFRVDGTFNNGKSFTGTSSTVNVIDAGADHSDDTNHGSVSN